ncbi:MAG: class I SAM-dependent methyltransferase, partial [Planctomycetes bacterium]|nr:class I SAM-dependent methyltransferase [Planctomycetota bacterium]
MSVEVKPGQTSEVQWDTPRLASPHAQADKSCRVRRMFDAIAPTYELVNSLSSAGRDKYWRRQMVKLADVRPDDVLLDVACG